MPTSPEALERALQGSPYLQEVAAPAVAALAATCLVRHYRRNTYLCHQGDPAPDVFFLLQGRVEISSVAANGNRVLHATLDTPQFLGELGVLGDIARTASALALEDVTVGVVNSEDFLSFLTREPSAARNVLRALARQVHADQSLVDDLLFLDLKGRVAKRLLQMVTPSLEQLPENGVVVPAVTHVDLASLCGGSRENVTRVLSEFQRRGLVEKDGRRYVLVKVEGLAKIAGL
jgi:CRP/FNR family transcriptional regulator/CRP/FNR family cyclic AMP-dependent transcriptional regulator